MMMYLSVDQVYAIHAAVIAAHGGGVTVEDLLQQITDDFLTRQEGFEVTAKYVLAKNAELYRRLA